MISIERKFSAYLDDMNLITILVPDSFDEEKSEHFYLLLDTERIALKLLQKSRIENHDKMIFQFTGEFCFGKQYWIADDKNRKTDLQIGAVIRTEAFDKRFYYEGNDLGVKYAPNRSQFKLWAPTATQVKLKLRPPSSPHSELKKMKRQDQGVWTLSIERDLELFEYSFLLQINQEWYEAVDPYVKAVSVNGSIGVIVDLQKTNRHKITLPPLESPVDAIIYETHIRDFSIHPNSGIKNKGLYLGGGELNTKGKDGNSTGLSYVKELGITHVEFLPFHDFAGVDELAKQNEYNWGYNPLHFNTPDGSYATKPADPYSRIIELKQLIDQVHQAGLKVIMDVVYNHVFLREESSFEKTVPGYFFRYDELGMPSNGTGVGNDIASERRMVRKFIVDSIRYWLEEYDVDGFRFDLMGILDIKTMKEVRRMCDRLKRGVIIIGEGWNLNTPLPHEQKAVIDNQAKMQGIGLFNDRFRDSIKGSTFQLQDKGYAMGDTQKLEAAFEALTGSIGYYKSSDGLFQEPFQSVNYVECHDNHTLWDKLELCYPDLDDTMKRRYHRLATSMAIVSQGIPFLHSGQEFFRTKYGEGNSYCSPDSINQLDWDRRSLYQENINYIKGLIEIRKGYPCFRMRNAEKIRQSLHRLSLTPPLLGCHFESGTQEVVLLINPAPTEQMVTVPNGIWTILANHEFANIFSEIILQEETIKLEPISIIILAKK